jgi:hypothetical protein
MRGLFLPFFLILPISAGLLGWSRLNQYGLNDFAEAAPEEQKREILAKFFGGDLAASSHNPPILMSACFLIIIEAMLGSETLIKSCDFIVSQHGHP